jgi:hypothetical protein
MNEVTTIGVDLAKNVFQVHDIDASGQVVVRRLSSPHGLYHLATVSLITFRAREDACRGHGAGGYDCTGGASG